MDPQEVVGVRVPASAANLGPGFDTFAVALGLHLTAWSDEAGPRHVVSSGEGAPELPTDDRNLVWRGFTAFCADAGVAVPDVSIVTRNKIPLERGLGSSAAAAVAGVSLARAMTGVRATHQELVDLVTDVEGHADNAAAAVMGGLVVCDGTRARRLEPTRSLQPVLCIPSARQSTNASRASLPTVLPVAEAAVNAARAALVLAGLAGTMGWEPEVLRDVLHEPARLEAMPETGALVRRLRAAGVGACLSGSGPTVLCIVETADLAAVDRVVDLAGEGWHVTTPGWDRGGTTLCPPSAAITLR